MNLEKFRSRVVSPPRWRLYAAGVLLLALALAGTPHQAAAGSPQRADSREVKAVFLVNFLSFAEWPAAKLGQPPARLVIAILGDPSFASIVEHAAAGRVIGGRPIAVQAVESPEPAAAAHLLFIASSQARRLPAVLRAVADSTVAPWCRSWRFVPAVRPWIVPSCPLPVHDAAHP